MPRWKRPDPGALLLVPQQNGKCTVVQVLDWPNKHIVSVCTFEPQVKSDYSGMLDSLTPFARLAVTTEALADGLWKGCGKDRVALPQRLWPFEHTRALGWVGFGCSSANVLSEFLDAWWGLVPWDSYGFGRPFDVYLLPGVSRPARAYMGSERS